jgi:hypothetical protein
MTPIDREIRAQVYRHIIQSGEGPTVDDIAASCSLDPKKVSEAFIRLENSHLLAMVPGEPRVMMAHPFSGVPTGHVAVVGEGRWHANCAWDALAILALMGDGVARVTSGTETLTWNVYGGIVSPEGVIHMRVPARSFWDDIGFT